MDKKGLLDEPSHNFSNTKEDTAAEELFQTLDLNSHPKDPNAYVGSLKRDGLGSTQVLAYSMGHMGNDISGSLWFTYLSYFLDYVVEVNSSVVGLALLVGQVADGLCTPFVGILVDKIDTRIGSRTPWYIAGTFLTLPSILGLFMSPNLEKDSIGELAFYMILPITMNIGFAFVQISCYAMVNSLTYST